MPPASLDLSKPPLVTLIAGPTASGKSALALKMARETGAVIINADSQQLYADLRILTARPSPEDEAQAEHRLYGVADAAEAWSVGKWIRAALAILAELRAENRPAILVGGTGLYFRALLEGLSDMPQADEALRAAITAEAQVRGWAALHAELARVDPAAAARIHATDAQRIQRALEVYRLSGRPISAWQRDAAGPRLPLNVLKLVLAPPHRDDLHARIEARFDAMLAAGFLDEVRALRALPELRAHPRPLDLPALRAVGYRQAWEHLDGASTLAEFRARAIAATRQLAKRQFTWLRGELDARWFDPAAQQAALDAAVDGFLGRARPA